MRKLLSGVLTVALVLPCAIPAASAAGTFQPDVTYELSVTAEERAAIHKEVDALSGDVGDVVVGSGKYDPLSLVGAMLDGSDYDSISYGRKPTVPTTYPFAVDNTESHRNEYDRKTAKFAWAEQLSKDLGFPVVVHRQDDKYVYIEIGDPDAPEMVMALSHLDSPTGSIKPEQLARWRSPDGSVGTDPDAYHTPYVQDGWIYGAGIQDDSGPTLATLYAAKALMEAGLPMDRRVRIMMGGYEDGGPGTPSVADTLKYMDIPYYTGNPSFYDNWAYKSLNREETPIAGYTSDSRFPVVVGNSKAWTPYVTMDLSADAGKAFSLSEAAAGVTLREGDDTLKDIVYGSAAQIASRAVFTLDAADAGEDEIAAFIAGVKADAEERGWLPTAEGKTAKVAVDYDPDAKTIVMEINTDVAMEYPTPQYGKNAIVWGMYLLSNNLKGEAADLQLKKAADGITDLFFRGCAEGEAYIGRYMGIPEELLRNPDSGVANLTFALMGNINNENLKSFYSDGKLSMPMQVRSMFANAEDYNAATAAVVEAFKEKGFDNLGEVSAYSNPTLYTSHDNPLVALQLASYKASMTDDPNAFGDVMDLLNMAYPVGTTGGTLASNFMNKMTAFGAVIPGNERWWHSANERMKVASAIQMTKMMADGMLEMARYSGPAGAQFMWADLDGLNADRAELDLLDVTVNTYQDASSAVLDKYLDGNELVAATKFDIEMWKQRGNASPTAAAFELGHEDGGVYLPLNDPDFLANTFVLPMRLEFKFERPANMSDSNWQKLKDGGFEKFSFNILNNDEVVPLAVPEDQDASKYFSTRVSQYDPDSIYVSVNLAITDDTYDGVETVIADSKTDLYKLSDEYLANNENPFPERGAVEERGFFVFGDGEKNACFSSPDAIYVTKEADTSSSGGGSSVTKYSVTVDKAANGTMKADKISASKGTKVTLTAAPDKGYELSAITVKDSKGNEIKVSEANGKYTFTMPASKVTVTAKFTAVDGLPFNDVKANDWFYDAVEYAYNNELFAGTSASKFSPNVTMTRGMLATVLYSMEGSPAVSGTSAFSDVAKGAWYYDAVRWAAKKGIVSGYDNGKFGPDDIVTREQMALILNQYAAMKGYDVSAAGSLNGFTDKTMVSDWAEKAVQWAVGEKLLSGKGNGILDPKSGATRAEVAQILMRFETVVVD